MIKYTRYLIMAVLALLLLSFSPIGKRKKPTLPPPKDCVGHIQWIQSVSYYTITDSSGAILKGDIIHDTDNGMPHQQGAPMRRQAINTPPIETWNYDEYGDQVEEDEYHSNGKIYHKITHAYYPDGDVKKNADSGNNKAFERTWKYTYHYDNSGKMLDSAEYYYSGNDPMLYSKRVNIYDSVGRLRKELTYISDTINPAIVTWKTYNDKGKLVETDERKREGTAPDLAPFEKNDFWYDKKGRLYDKATYKPRIGLVKDEKITFDSTGKTITTYSYKENKVLTGSIEKRVFSQEGPLEKAINTTIQEDTYDADGLLTDYIISHDSAKHVMDKGVFHITYHSYIGADHRTHNRAPGDTAMVHHIINDDHFNIVVDDHFSNDGKTKSQKSYQYTYDSIGNWIEKIEFNGDTPVKITEREIGYFKE